MQLLGSASFVSILLIVSSVKATAPLEDRLSLRANQELNKERKEVVLKLLSALLDSSSNQMGIENTFPDQEDMEEMKVEDRSRFSQLPQRERKTSCKNFFWKTFTSC
ncbi:somatostatin-2-like [Rhincodon typus]|uniref:somatostatin-2-like n=1 Tax=Rhincodon typus TaxID=259920 RepID=UPI00202F47FF|nr:somatostatin-2-like [Rhincodon typus]